jgi:hypothetical protein
MKTCGPLLNGPSKQQLTVYDGTRVKQLLRQSGQPPCSLQPRVLVYRDPPHYSSFVPSTARSSISRASDQVVDAVNAEPCPQQIDRVCSEADEAWRCLLAAQVDDRV